MKTKSKAAKFKRFAGVLFAVYFIPGITYREYRFLPVLGVVCRPAL